MAKLLVLAILSVISYSSTKQIPTSFNTVKMPESCLGKTYCTEKPADYPEESFRALVTSLELRAVDDMEIGHRSGDDTSRTICPANEIFPQIYLLIDEEGNTRYVAQLENEFVQKLTIKECMKPGRIESGAHIMVDEDVKQYNVSCIETKKEQPFVVLSLDHERIEIATPRGGVPVTCSLRYSSL